MFDPSIGRWLEEDPLGFEAGDANLYRYAKNAPTGATDPSGMITDAEASLIVNQVLDGTRPAASLSSLTPQQLEREIAIFRRVIQSPRGQIPAQLIRDFNEARIAFLRGAGPRPGALLEYAEGWLSRQSAQWIQANASTVEKIATQAARSREIAAARAARAAAAAVPAADAVASWSSRAMRALRYVGVVLATPEVIAVSDILIDPTPTAPAGGVPRGVLTLPSHSPELYWLPQGTVILPNGMIYVPAQGHHSGPQRGRFAFAEEFPVRMFYSTSSGRLDLLKLFG